MQVWDDRVFDLYLEVYLSMEEMYDRSIYDLISQPPSLKPQVSSLYPVWLFVSMLISSICVIPQSELRTYILFCRRQVS
jgi:hypothetical protein